MQENSEENPGEDFLEKKDEKHRKLLLDFNGLIDEFVQLENSQHLNKLKVDGLDPKTALRKPDTGKKNNKSESTIKLFPRLKAMLHNTGYIEKYKQKLKQYSKEHYNTVIARMQAGIPYAIWKAMMETSDGIQNNKVMKVIKNSGMIVSRYNNTVYLINPYDTKKKTLKLILNEVKAALEAVSVIAHCKTQYNSTLEEWIKGDFDNKLYLCPYNDNLLSWISSRQTEGVENTCKIINYFTEKSNNKQIDVTLEGASQGVDFITKMVGSTHGKTNRIKNANITLKIDSTHLFQDGQKIVNRLIKGISNEENNNNTITNISIDNSMGDWIHPTCKTNSLKKWLEHNNKALNNAKIEDLRRTSKQQHALN